MKPTSKKKKNIIMKHELEEDAALPLAPGFDCDRIFQMLNVQLTNQSPISISVENRIFTLISFHAFISFWDKLQSVNT